MRYSAVRESLRPLNRVVKLATGALSLLLAWSLVAAALLDQASVRSFSSRLWHGGEPHASPPLSPLCAPPTHPSANDTTRSAGSQNIETHLTLSVGLRAGADDPSPSLVSWPPPPWL